MESAGSKTEITVRIAVTTVQCACCLLLLRRSDVLGEAEVPSMC